MRLLREQVLTPSPIASRSEFSGDPLDVNDVARSGAFAHTGVSPTGGKRLEASQDFGPVLCPG
jgi:hypothetical protein